MICSVKSGLFFDSFSPEFAFRTFDTSLLGRVSPAFVGLAACHLGVIGLRPNPPPILELREEPEDLQVKPDQGDEKRK